MTFEQIWRGRQSIGKSSADFVALEGVRGEDAVPPPERTKHQKPSDSKGTTKWIIIGNYAPQRPKD